jgi:hypothetical protein
MSRDTDKIGGFEVTRVGRRGMLDYRDCFLGVPVALAGVFACLCDVHKLLPFFVSSGSGYCLCECTTKMMLTVYF